MLRRVSTAFLERVPTVFLLNPTLVRQLAEQHTAHGHEWRTRWGRFVRALTPAFGNALDPVSWVSVLTLWCPRVTVLVFGAQSPMPPWRTTAAVCGGAGWSRLHRLVFRDCPMVDDECIRQIACADFAPDLEWLDLSNCPFITGTVDDCLWMLFHTCRNLAHLNLLGCTGIPWWVFDSLPWTGGGLWYLNLAQTSVTDKALDTMVRGGEMRALEQLNLGGCHNVSDAALHALTSRRAPREGESVSLHCLDVSDCPGVRDEGVVCVARRARGNLVEVRASRCPITDRTLQAIAESCHASLTTAVFADCPFVHDRGVASIMTSCKLLTTLNISHCLRVTDAAGSALFADSLSSLRELSVSGCTNLTLSGVEHVVESCESLHTLAMADCPLIDQAIADCGVDLSVDRPFTRIPVIRRTEDPIRPTVLQWSAPQR